LGSGYRLYINISGFCGFRINKPLRNEVGRKFILQKFRDVAFCVVLRWMAKPSWNRSRFPSQVILFLRLSSSDLTGTFWPCLMRADSYLDSSTCKDACVRISATMANSMDTSRRWCDDSFPCAFIQFIDRRRRGSVHIWSGKESERNRLGIYTGFCISVWHTG
jgi:hypothetical protein